MPIEPNFFNAYYYAHDCGRPYQRDEVWLDFFETVAERIVQSINPRSVLDAGCAWGFLVESLRRRGVEAFGVDISEYAIQNVHPDVAPYCWVGSITDPFPQAYDLIVCSEVLEHLEPQVAEKAVVNFCQHSRDVLFSSTPYDYKEATHFNVRPLAYWAGLFARQGFYRDVAFEASFLTPWTVRFREGQRNWPEVIQAYERTLWDIQQENTALREATLEMRHKLAEYAPERVEEMREALIHDLESCDAEIARLSTLVEGYERGRLMRLMRRLDTWFNSFRP